MEYDLFFLIQDEPSLKAEKGRTAFARQRRGSLDANTTPMRSLRRPSFPALPQPHPRHHLGGGFAEPADEDKSGGLFASFGRAIKSFASASGGPSSGDEWTPATVSPRRERRGSI